MLTDKFFLWPEDWGDSLAPCISEITPILAKSGMSDWMRCLEGNLAEYIALECRHWNINPYWLLASSEREQSTLTTPKMSPQAVAAWLGVVGQDVGRTSLPGYYGVYMQIPRFCDTVAWLLGVEPSEKWPEEVRTRKQVARFHTGISLDVVPDDTPGGKGLPHTCGSAGEYMQLAYTPHMPILVKNEGYVRNITPIKYLS